MYVNKIRRTRYQEPRSRDATSPRCFHTVDSKKKKRRKKLRLELHLQVFPCEAREKGQNAKRQRDGRRKKKKGEKKHDKTLS